MLLSTSLLKERYLFAQGFAALDLPKQETDTAIAAQLQSEAAGVFRDVVESVEPNPTCPRVRSLFLLHPPSTSDNCSAQTTTSVAPLQLCRIELVTVLDVLYPSNDLRSRIERFLTYFESLAKEMSSTGSSQLSISFEFVSLLAGYELPPARQLSD